MRKRRRATVKGKKSTLHKRIAFLFTFATITTVLIFIVSVYGVAKKTSVLGIAIRQLAMIPIDGGGGGGVSLCQNSGGYCISGDTAACGNGYRYASSAMGCLTYHPACCLPLPTPTFTPVPTLPDIIYPTRKPVPLNNIPGTHRNGPVFLDSSGHSYNPSSNNGYYDTQNVGNSSQQQTGAGQQQSGQQQSNGTYTPPSPTPTETPSQVNQDVTQYLLEQFPTSPTPMPTSAPDSTQSPSGPTPTIPPPPTVMQQQNQSPQNHFVAPPQVPNTPVPPSQQSGQQNMFRSFFNVIPFFKQGTSSQQTPISNPTPTPGPLFQGNAAIVSAVQVQQEIKVQVTIQNGNTVVTATRADGAKVVLSDSARDRLLALMAQGDLPSIQKNNNSSFIIKTGDTEAVTSFPTSIDLPFGIITITTPDGDKQLGIVPDQAVQLVLQSNELDKVDRKQSLWDYIVHGSSTQKLDRLISITSLSDGTLSYAVTGTITKRFIASFPIDIKKTVYISTDTGTIQKTSEDPLANTLDKISVPFVAPVSIP